jgi:hypothetical protein
LEKLVITSHFTIIIVTLAIADTNFLTKMQKKGNPLNGNCTPATINLQKMIVTVRFKFLGLCQLIDIN